ncbi:hypothetical protein ASPVEDRAFT_83691 [Aspergillus versicolor CBS 583.65]|uniref:Uncharacterized protein n=1 Tax=Aspergillus versicolor CBS 583.65 TaxID=1036611 RepID=A0A1L9PKX3_ASPVE|nr:uncharacterized protein ASPVEDRAFT_83691 [Aspergillus versicolor CBS 583.65]OJJ02178.1 hypothetical protein ASPVEDRAFT_83691 [Aspergillus versicolor CBS 583.65]
MSILKQRQAVKAAELSVDETPGLKSCVYSMQVNGNPYPMPNCDNLYYRSVILLDKDGERVISAHAYLNRYVKFSKKATFKPVKLPPMPGTPVILLKDIVTGRSDSKPGFNQSTSKKGK